MSDAQQDPIPSPPTETNAVKAGVDWVAKHWPRVRLGHEAVILNKIERQNRIVETLARNSMTGEMQDTTGWPDSEGDDRMGVKIGDRIENHYHLPAESRETQSARQGAAGAFPWKGLAAAVLASGLLGTAGGLGIPWLLGALDQKPAAEQASTDTDTQYRLELVPEADLNPQP